MNYEELYQLALTNGLGSMTNQFGQMNSGGRGADELGQTPWNYADVGNGMSYVEENGQRRIVMPSDNPERGKLMAYAVDASGRPVGEPFYYTNQSTLKAFGSDLRDLAPVILAAVGGAMAGGAGGAADAAMGIGAGSGNTLTPALMESMIGTAGYGASSAGLGELAGMSAGALGGADAAASLSGGSALDGAFGGLSSADKAALFGDVGYGPGMTGAQTGIFDAVNGFTGSPALASVAAGSNGAGLLSTIASGLGQAGSNAASALGGGQAVAGLLGAVAGSQGTPGGTQTNQRTLDPRIDSLVFGSNGSGGLLGDAMNWYQANKSGQNDTMRTAQTQQQAMLTDPRVLEGLYTMGGRGIGMMQQPIASNPFTRPGFNGTNWWGG
jgi:hypothetical protein